jgi:hypothetical protein
MKGVRNTAQWANYPGWCVKASSHQHYALFCPNRVQRLDGTPLMSRRPEPALMISQMIHVWDHFDYTNDVGWWKAQGWPLLKVIREIFSFLRHKSTTFMHIGSSELPSRQAYARPLLQ